MSKKRRELNRTERAAQMRKEAERAERSRKLIIGGAVLVALVLVVVAVLWSQRGGDSAKIDTSIPAAKGDHSLLVGPDSAPHKVVVHEDFLCPFCREFEQGARKYLHDAAKKGTLQVEYRPFQLLPDDYSKEALAAFAYVLENGSANQALAFHDLLYDKQPYEQQSNKPNANKIANWAKDIGVSKSATRKAIDSGMTDWSKAASQLAEKDGVQGTPTVVVDGKKVEGGNISELITNLEQLTAK